MKSIEDFFAEYMQYNDVEDSAAINVLNTVVLNYLGSIAPIDKQNVDDMLSNLCYEHEKQGFVNGFRYAFSCMQKNVGRCMI